MGEEIPETRHADEALEPLILAIRGWRVIIDVDLARLYGVATKALNQAVKRNRNRFPDDFALQLSVDEYADIRSRHMLASSQALDRKWNIQDRSQIGEG